MWDVLAEGAAWSRKQRRRAGRRPLDRRRPGQAARSTAMPPGRRGKGILALRNPGGSGGVVRARRRPGVRAAGRRPATVSPEKPVEGPARRGPSGSSRRAGRNRSAWRRSRSSCSRPRRAAMGGFSLPLAGEESRGWTAAAKMTGLPVDLKPCPLVLVADLLGALPGNKDEQHRSRGGEITGDSQVKQARRKINPQRPVHQREHGEDG